MCTECCLLFSGQKGEGRNASGQIWQNIRSSAYPRYILFGDSIIREVEIDNVTTLSVPGGSLKRMATFAHVLSIVPERCIIIHFGVNDLVDFDGSTNYKSTNANALARCLVSTAMSITAEHGVTVILCTVLRRRGTSQSQRKISLLNRCLIDQTLRKTTNNVHIFNAFDSLNDDKFFDAGGVHLNPLGAKLYSSLLRTAIHQFERGQTSQYLY
uniref:SGNH hydrolase-type esterase domain-containing protein n=1 Tax=Romanomermis culicivorax TaxID=13658 RepID=A0A915KX89_ROMCU